MRRLLTTLTAALLIALGVAASVHADAHAQGKQLGNDWDKTGSCVTAGDVNAVEVGDTQAHVENVQFDGYKGSLSEVPHDTGTQWLKTKAYDICGDPYGIGQIRYRADTDDGPWTVKRVQLFL